jgi:hypothetical protein
MADERAGDLLPRLAVYHWELAMASGLTARTVRASETSANRRYRDTQTYEPDNEVQER